MAKELAAFRNFRKKRRQAGEWQDFGFRAVSKVRGHNLNDAGRLAVRKDAGEVAVAGLAVLAADTGRVLMLQRALCDDDPAAGKFELPGGHLAEGEAPRAAACASSKRRRASVRRRRVDRHLDKPRRHLPGFRVHDPQ